jgi:hypothetical protein
MDQEPVTAYEVDEYPEEEHYRSRRLTAGPIIAIVVVVIILLALGFYFLWGTSVDEVRVLEVDEVMGPDENFRGIEVRVIAISSGAQRVDGAGTLDIIHSGSKVFSTKVDVENDEGRTTVDYEEFAIKNGVYEIRFTMEGKTGKADEDFFVRHVPETLEIEFAQTYDQETEDTKTLVVVTPRIEIPEGGRAILVKDYNRHYRVTLVTIDPFGERSEQERTMYEWHQNQSSLQIDLGWELMGNYTVSAEFTNLLVREDSEFRTLASIPEEVTTFINKAPLMGDIDHSPSRVRVGQEFELTMRAFDQDSNGGIEYFMIDWDAEDDEDELEVIYVDGSQTALARVSHTYSETGPKTITITVADNGFVDDSNPDRLINEKKFASTLYDVNVRVL